MVCCERDHSEVSEGRSHKHLIERVQGTGSPAVSRIRAEGFTAAKDYGKSSRAFLFCSDSSIRKFTHASAWLPTLPDAAPLEGSSECSP